MDIKHAKNFKDLTGKSFSNWIVISVGQRIFTNNKKPNTKWLCQCSCGVKKLIDGGSLKNGDSQSCGCLYGNGKGVINITHNFSKTEFYALYRSILVRCNNKKSKSYKDYGDRGIKCLWRDFESYKGEMYKSYLEHLERFGRKNTLIERIDNNGNYCKENCRWATKTEQARNKRSNVFYTYLGETHCISEWAEIYRMPYGKLNLRLQRYKWLFEEAIS